MRRGTIVLGEPPTALAVEVAETRAERVRGLMFRREVPEGTGMLFFMEREAVQAFTMRNVRVPLDLIFMDSRAKVVGAVMRVQPGTPGPVGIHRPSRIVLETAAGFVERHAVTLGERAQIRL